MQVNNYVFRDNKYTNWYNSIIINAKNEKRIKGNNEYYENHHILPKSLGGSNDLVNMVLLTAKEHYICHLLLIKMVETKDVYKMIHAIIRFSKYAKNSNKYEILRSKISKYSKGEYNASHGKVWCHNTETLEIIYLPKEEFNVLDTSKFKKGLPYQRGGHRNTTYMNNGQKEILVTPDKLQLYINDGWSAGRLHKATHEHLCNMAKNRHTAEKDKAHSKLLTGRITLQHTETGKIKRICPSNLAEYINKGYSTIVRQIQTNSSKCSINGIVYPSVPDAVANLNLPKWQIEYRLDSKSSKWKNWFKLPK